MNQPDTDNIVAKLHSMYPHGHAAFNDMCIDEMELHSRKNHDYARGGDPLGNFNRVSEFFQMYPGLTLSDPAVVALVYAMKQVDACLWMMAGEYEGPIEGVASRLGDVSVYAKLAIILHKQTLDEQREAVEMETPLPGDINNDPLNEFDPEAYLKGRSYGDKTPITTELGG